MGQLPFNLGRPNYMDHIIVGAYGGGVNTIAWMIQMQRQGYRPRALLMANPGSEDPRTIAYRDSVVAEWCDSVGWPRVVEITRWDEGKLRDRVERFETLREECARIKSLPSVAYGFKRCSLKFKRDPQLWYLARQEWAQAEWEAGRKIVRVIGYDASESHRVMYGFDDKYENARYIPFYPLVEEGIDREQCIDLIRSEGLSIPVKSACDYCANRDEDEWRDLHRMNPIGFADAVQMSRDAAAGITSPDVVGLLRRREHGSRQLHEWFDAGMPRWDGSNDGETPCECAQ